MRPWPITGKSFPTPKVLAEYARQALSRQITSQYVVEGQTLKVITVSGKLKKSLRKAFSKRNTEAIYRSNRLFPMPSLQAIKNNLKSFPYGTDARYIMLACHPDVLAATDGKIFSADSRLSYNELEADVEVQSVGVVDIE